MQRDATAPSSSNVHGRRSTREFDTFPLYEKHAESIFSGFFFHPQPNQRLAVTQTRHPHPSRAFHFILTILYLHSSFVALFPSTFLLSLLLCLLFYSPLSISLYLSTTLTVSSLSLCSFVLSSHLQPSIHLLSHTITRLCAFRSLANNAVAALAPTCCFH